MGTTTAMNTADALAVKVWNENLFEDVIKGIASKNLTGYDVNSMIQLKRDLEKNQGEIITMPIMANNGASFLSEGTDIYGNENTGTTYAQTITLAEKAMGIKVTLGIDSKRPAFKMTDAAQKVLANDVAVALESDTMSVLTTSPTKIVYATGNDVNVLADDKSTIALAGAEIATITGTKLSPRLISKLVAEFKTGFSSATWRPRPIMQNGRPHYVLLINPLVADDIRNDATYASYIRDAEVRGKDNPFFSGALAVVHGVVLIESENMPTAVNASDVTFAQSVMCGAQAMCQAWGLTPELRSYKYPYDQHVGYGWVGIWKTVRTAFNSKDYSSVALVTATSTAL